jgi:pyroglutamyl-peptidase
MSDGFTATAPLRILVTGFGPFPGAPFNPTMPLVERLAERHRPARDGVALTSHIFHVTYETVDRELPELIARVRPQALLMFGLASRTGYLRIETRARNAVTTHLTDADGNRAQDSSIVPSAAPLTFGPHTASLLQAARAAGIDARLSRDAGTYLCNYLSWRAIEATQRPGGPALASFIHVPLLAREGASGITLEQLVNAAGAVLTELVTLVRDKQDEVARAEP